MRSLNHRFTFQNCLPGDCTYSGAKNTRVIFLKQKGSDHRSLWLFQEMGALDKGRQKFPRNFIAKKRASVKRGALRSVLQRSGLPLQPTQFTGLAHVAAVHPLLCPSNPAMACVGAVRRRFGGGVGISPQKQQPSTAHRTPQRFDFHLHAR